MEKNVNRQCKKNGYILRIVNYDMFFKSRAFNYIERILQNI